MVSPFLYDFIYHRGPSLQGDADLKRDALNQLCIDMKMSPAKLFLTARFYDDNKGVLTMAAKDFGIATVYAPHANARLSA